MTDPYRLPEEPAWPAQVYVSQQPAVDDEPGTDSASAHESTLADTRTAVAITLVLTVLGALLGLAWAFWSGPQQRAFVIAPGQREPFDEVETMVAADARYLVLVGATGVLAALVTWWLRPANRGALVVLALAAGGLAGSALTWFVGYLAGGGTYDGATGTVIKHLPLSLHMHGLVFIEPALASMIYGLFVAFAARDDLGRADPVRERLSVGVGGQPHDGRGNGDRPGAPQ